MRQITGVLVLTVIAAVVATIEVAMAAPFSGGIVAERIGGTATFTSGPALASGVGAPIFIDEFNPTTNARIQSIALPSTDPDAEGPQRSIVENGSTNQVGFISRSVNENYIMATGIGVDAGTSGVPGAATTNNRIIARIDGSGNVDTSTGFSEANSVNTNTSASVRSVASVDGTKFYVGTGNTTAGTRYIDTFGAIDDTTERVSGATSQVRTIGIFGDRMFYTNSATYSLRSVKDTITGGLPVNESSTSTVEILPITANSSPEQFVFLDLVDSVGFDGTGLDTLYLTHAGVISATNNPTTGSDLNSGGLQKYTFDGANFVQQITFNSGLSSTNTDPLFGGLQGLVFSGFEGGNPVFFASTSAPSTTGNSIVKIADSGTSSAFTSIATAPLNSVFRGLALAPVNAPPAVPGDYNGNGKVDAADYVVWRNGGPLLNEVDTPGTINAQDYTEWRSRFGNPGSGGGLGAAVPEPPTFLMIGLILALGPPFVIRKRG
jgi:hypothetical protein